MEIKKGQNEAESGALSFGVKMQLIGVSMIFITVGALTAAPPTMLNMVSGVASLLTSYLFINKGITHKKEGPE